MPVFPVRFSYSAYSCILTPSTSCRLTLLHAKQAINHVDHLLCLLAMKVGNDTVALL